MLGAIADRSVCHLLSLSANAPTETHDGTMRRWPRWVTRDKPRHRAHRAFVILVIAGARARV
jgi:hypothetical protein